MHIPVLLRETIGLLNLHEGYVVVDGTVGSGGHAKEIAVLLGKKGTLIGLDQDSDSLKRSTEALAAASAQVKLIRNNFRNLDAVLAAEHLRAIDAFLLDLGWSMDQFEGSGRGFSFGSDEPLLMTLEKDPNPDTITAREIVNTYAEDQLSDLIYAYGEEQFSRRIARAIVERRKVSPIITTKELVEVIEKAVPKFYLFRRIHPATKTFQALRIAVNDELGALREGLAKGLAALRPGGRIVVITFHSLEDRIVKQTFKEWSYQGLGSVLTKKPIVAGEAEIAANRRARSAKLRGFEKA